MKHKLVFLLFCFFIFPIVFSSEITLTTLGIDELRVNEFNSFQCVSTTFSKNNYFNNYFGLHPVLSLFADFDGKDFDSSFVSVELNGVRNIIWKEDFVCENNCVTRVFLDELKAINELTICVRTGLSKISVLSNSIIGFYDTPVLKIETLGPEEVVLGERAKMVINLVNSGSKQASVFVQFVAEDLRSLFKITSFDIVEGDASASTIVLPNESKSFTFFIKPTSIAKYNISSSELQFTNIFGEKQKILSNHPQLSVVEPNQASLTLIGLDIVDGELNFSLRIKNNWDSKLIGKISFFPFDSVDFVDNNLELNPFSEKEFSLSTKKLVPGEYFLSAQLTTNDFNYFSENISFEIIERNYFFEVIFSIIAIVVTLLIFLTIYFNKQD